MAQTKKPKELSLTQLAKCPTGIKGLDDITNGGLPQGRPTLVCGSAGCGKTLLAMEFIVRGPWSSVSPGSSSLLRRTPRNWPRTSQAIAIAAEEVHRRHVPDGKDPGGPGFEIQKMTVFAKPERGTKCLPPMTLTKSSWQKMPT
jgi:hypothetical protein